MMEWAQTSLGMSEADSYHLAFAVACASLVFLLLFIICSVEHSNMLTVQK